MRQFFFFFFGTALILLTACNRGTADKPDVLDKKTKSREVYIDEKDSVGSVQQVSTIDLRLQLINTVYSVRSEVEGEILHSELKTFQPQLIDSSTLLLSVDNREDFIRLRSQKLALVAELKKAEEQMPETIKDEIHNFVSLLKVDNLLPGLNPNKFSADFIQWFTKQPFYLMYKEILLSEEKMATYFFMNDTAIVLKTIHARVGTKVRKNQVVYRYLKQKPFLNFRADFPYSESEIGKVEMISPNIEKFQYRVKDGRIIVSLPMKTYFSLDSVDIHIQLKGAQS